MPTISTSIGSGISIPLLTSTSNFQSWSRTFEGIARWQNLWVYFSGTEPILPEPVKPRRNEAAPDADDWKEMVAEYKDDRDEWRYQKKKVANALGLLKQCVHESYHQQQLFERGNDPVAAWNFVKGEFALPEWQLQMSAYEAFFKVYLSEGKLMIQYIDEFIQAQNDIKTANGACPDSMIIARMCSTLPAEYNHWVVKNIKTVKEMPELTDIIASLLATESLVKPSRR